jgi:hypothetical protein
MRRRTGAAPPRFPRLFSSLPETAHGTRRRKAATGAASPDREHRNSPQRRRRPGHPPRGAHARTNQPAATHGTTPPEPKLIDAERSQIQPLAIDSQPIGISPRILPVSPSSSLSSPPSFRIHRRSLSGPRRCRSASRPLAARLPGGL